MKIYFVTKYIALFDDCLLKLVYFVYFQNLKDYNEYGWCCGEL